MSFGSPIWPGRHFIGFHGIELRRELAGQSVRQPESPSEHTVANSFELTANPSTWIRILLSERASETLCMGSSPVLVLKPICCGMALAHTERARASYSAAVLERCLIA